MSKYITREHYDKYCEKGFFITKERIETPNNWIKKEVLDYNFYLSPTTNFNILNTKDHTIILIGRLFDLENKKAINKIALKVSELLLISFESALEYISYLGGRYLVLILQGNELLAIPDNHCTYSCYWTPNIKYTLASHTQIFKDYFGIGECEYTRSIMSHEDYASGGGKYHPGKLTPLKEVYPLIANCFLKINVTGEANHVRFYPNISLDQKFKGITLDEKYFLFKKYLIESIQQAYQKDKLFFLALTNGGDSRTILSAIMMSDIKDFLSYTYTSFNFNSESLSRDLLGASRLATSVKVPHLVLSLPKLDYGSDFFKMYAKTFSSFARFPTLAQAHYEQMPEDSIIVFSTISETGTVFYTQRDEEIISPEGLSRKWSTSKINQLKEVHEVFEDYINYTDFRRNKLYDFDYNDLFYWEHRNSKWANLWYQECDLSHDVSLPFNARIITEIMLSIPIEERKNKYFLNRLISDAGLSCDEDYFA